MASWTATESWAWSDQQEGLIYVSQNHPWKLQAKSSEEYPNLLKGSDTLILRFQAFVEAKGNLTIIQADSLEILSTQQNDLILRRKTPTGGSKEWILAKAFESWKTQNWNQLELLASSDSIWIRVNLGPWQRTASQTSGPVSAPGSKWCLGCGSSEYKSWSVWLDLVSLGAIRSGTLNLNDLGNSSSSQMSSSALISSSSQMDLSSSQNPNTFVDSRDMQSYTTVTIGSQTWIAQELNYGTLEPSANTLQQANQKYCYQNLTEECSKGGGLYQWHRAMNLHDTCATKSCANLIQSPHQGICPAGWHIPSPAEWQQLGQALGGLSTAGATMKWNNTPWGTWNTPFNDGNSSGFSAYPNGLRYFDGTYKYHGSESSGGPVWWTTEEWSSDTRNAHRYYINNLDASLATNINHEKRDAMSVRCIKDSSPP
jgi:uncharacterized protein (TIGR02145 family)